MGSSQIVIFSLYLMNCVVIQTVIALQPKFSSLTAHGSLVFVTLGKGKANIFHSVHALEMLKALS